MTPDTCVPIPVQLPTADVRSWLNERAMRLWTDSSRRGVRVLTLLASDSAAALLGLGVEMATWSVVSGGGVRPVPDLVPLLAMVLCLQPLALRVTGAYASGRARTHLARIAGGVALAALLGWIQARLFGSDTPGLPNKAAYLYAAALITTGVWLFRHAIDRCVAAARRSGLLQRRVLLIGSLEDARDLQRRCTLDPASEIRIVGRLDPGDDEDLPQAMSAARAESVMVVANMPFASLEALVGRCFAIGASVSVVPRLLQELSGTQLEVGNGAVGSFLQLSPIRLDVPQLAVKRAIDIVLTLGALALTWPILALVALAIKCDSRGPILFRQERVGLGGTPFKMLKFRTMCDGADAVKQSLQHLNESGDPRLFKIKNDPRVTRVGRFLRRTSLDELPQVFNVLRGEMSLVGPRPFFPRDLAGYDPHHFERLHVLQGITGLWQVSGRSDVVDFEEVIRLDREYIRNWSVLSDLSILLRTIPAALGRGAY